MDNALAVGLIVVAVLFAILDRYSRKA